MNIELARTIISYMYVLIHNPFMLAAYVSDSRVGDGRTAIIEESANLPEMYMCKYTQRTHYGGCSINAIPAGADGTGRYELFLDASHLPFAGIYTRTSLDRCFHCTVPTKLFYTLILFNRFVWA